MAWSVMGSSVPGKFQCCPFGEWQAGAHLASRRLLLAPLQAALRPGFLSEAHGAAR